ncbi:P-loop containing nucleoside triphosphate hydrolase protein [Mycena rebaudengoi]|nr:P-loop containing nucleoside triphosphate hydrolase protein [Mycena rebaudengoi]
MKVSIQLENLIQYTTSTASTVKEIAGSFQIPFLASATTLTLSILKCVESIKSNRDEWMIMVEQIHEILCTIAKLCSTSEIQGVLPTAVLYDIAIFSETLQKIFTFLKVQQKMGKIKQLFKQSDNAERLEICKQELNKAVEMFRVRAGGSALFHIGQMKKDAKQQHEELIALLDLYPDLSSSDHSSVTGTLSSASNSSGSFSLLPASPKIFYGRESELHVVVNILLQDSARVAILGAGGMGKTSLATVALHNPQVEVKYARRYFVPCHSSATCTELVAAIADHIGVEKGSNLSKKVAHYFAHAPPSLLVLDNLETPWESNSSRHEVEEFLSLLADVLQLGLMITLRGTERPGKVKWTRPFVQPLNPLSKMAALKTFKDIADDAHDDENVNQLLELTSNLPLAINLIASVASSEGCAKALSRWHSESTRMLSDGYDQRSSLDISIMLSFTSSRMTTGAQALLSILSMLPNGLTDADLVQAQLPISNILACKTTLVQTALAFVGQDQHLKVLVPIRGHILHMHPPANALKLKLREHFHQILDLWSQFKNLNIADRLPQISQNLGNFNTVLLDGLGPEGPDIVQNFKSILFLNDFYGRVHSTYSPLLLQLSGQMSHWKDDSIYVGTSP